MCAADTRTILRVHFRLVDTQLRLCLAGSASLCSWCIACHVRQENLSSMVNVINRLLKKIYYQKLLYFYPGIVDDIAKTFKNWNVYKRKLICSMLMIAIAIVFSRVVNFRPTDALYFRG